MATGFESIQTILTQIEAENPQNSAELDVFRIKYIGSKGLVKEVMGLMGSIPNAQKRDFGQAVNALKDSAESKFLTLKAQFEDAAENNSKTTIDFSAPGEPIGLGSRHPVSIVMQRIIEIFGKLGFSVADGPEIDNDWYNFTAMNTPEDHPARDMQDTFYLKNSTSMLLRTHTSNVQSRVMTSRKPPIRIIAPGRVYRNETISARSHAQFHQVEGLYIDENVSFADLKQTLQYFAEEMFGTPKIQLRPSFFPFTEPSAEMDIWIGTETEETSRLSKGTGWLEILGCGMVDPQVLENCGIDPKKYSGFAFGMGVERQALRLFTIPDIRLLFENDGRFLKQFQATI